VLVVALTFISVPSGSIGASSAKNENIDSLLQTYLFIYEIEQETKRLEKSAEKIAAKINKTRSKQAKQAEIIDANKAGVAQVLRSYYLGERDLLWTVLFSARSWSDAWYLYDLLQTIFLHDFKRLNKYIDAIEAYQKVIDRLQKQKNELAKNSEQLRNEKLRVQKLQTQLEAKLAAMPNSNQTIARLKAFAREWQTQGLPLFQTYFATMVKSVSGLPKYIMDERQFKGTTLYITDQQFNTYLREKNNIFANTVVSFANGQLHVAGKNGNIHFKISGKYMVQEKPRNALKFKMTGLEYQKLALPDTTMRYLSSLYDLSLYPDEFSSAVKIRDVEMKNGKLTIKLKMNFSSLF
jgi:hypothetical protein